MTIDEAKTDLEETLDDILEDYVLCDESDLHESGIELRRWFIDNSRVIQTYPSDLGQTRSSMPSQWLEWDSSFWLQNLDHRFQ